MPGWNLQRGRYLRIGAAALLALPAMFTMQGFAQHIETSTFNQAPLRPAEDPKAVAKGKQLYDAQCASCHSADLRGVENKGPNLLRSQDGLTDKRGENLVPIIQGKKAGIAGHKFYPSMEDANAVATYVRSVIALIGSQGRPPGESTRSPNVLVGNAESGKVYFANKCASCHSVTGDLKGIGSKLSNPKMLQAAWVKGTYFGIPAPTVTAKITEPGKPTIEGAVIHVDDFLVTLKIQDGSMVTVRRRGAVPKVEVHDPLEAHRNLLPGYTDKDIHDVTAYLVTLK